MNGPVDAVLRGSDAERGHRFHDLAVRAASGLVLVVIALGSVRAGGASFAIIWLLAASAVYWEWVRLGGGAASLLRLILGWLALAAAADLDLPPAFLPLGLAAAAAVAVSGSGKRVWAAAGVGYSGLFLIALIALRGSAPDGTRSILWLFATVWSTDVFAYFGGRLIGGPKIWPRVSPSKTWSGTLTGVVAGGLIGTFVAVHDLPGPTAVVPVFAVTLASAFVSQLGDAFESAAKRRFGVKDTSRLIPGHGGFMDRLDGFIAATVFAFLIGWTRDPAAVALGLFRWA